MTNKKFTFFYPFIFPQELQKYSSYEKLLLCYCRFSCAGNWELVKSIMGTKYRRSHVCLHSQAGNRLWRANSSALLHCAMISSVQKLTQMIKSNTVVFLRIQRQQENTKENTKKTTETNWDWSKNISWLILVRTCEMSLLLISRF